MKLTINNEIEVLDLKSDVISVSELLQIKKFTYKMLVVRVNDVLVLKENYSTTNIKNGDNIQVIHLMSGG